MRRFNVRRSFIIFEDGRMSLYLQLEHATIFIRLRPVAHNMRYGQRIRCAILEEKIVVPMTGVNEYFGRAVFLR